MKQAYVSVVVPCNAHPSEAELQHLDRALTATCRAHEIVVVVPHAHEREHGQDALAVGGPISVVTTYRRTSRDAPTLAGLGRAAGDFIIEWQAPLEHLTQERVREFLAPSDEGVELVEVMGVGQSALSRTFYRMVNALRTADAPVRRSVGRVYSRRALNHVLSGATFDDRLVVLVAEVPFERSQLSVPCPLAFEGSTGSRITDGLSLLARGTRFGTAVPLALAFVSAVFGLAAALYAVLILTVRGRTPEGWTTLMVVTGLGQAAILTMLGLTWSRLNTLTRGLTQSVDVTADVQVRPPSDPPG